MRNVSIPETASVSRIRRLIAWTAGMSIAPGSLPARNPSISPISASTWSRSSSNSSATRLRKSRCRRTSWSNTAMFPDVWYATTMSFSF